MKAAAAVAALCAVGAARGAGPIALPLQRVGKTLQQDRYLRHLADTPQYQAVARAHRGAGHLSGGYGIGMYTTTMMVGGQEFHLQLDTGSSDLWLVGANCTLYATKECVVQQGPGNGTCASRSTNAYDRSGVNTGITIKDCYGMGFSVNEVFVDTVSVNGVEAQQQYFGSATQAFSDWFEQPKKFDGIFGLAHGDLSEVTNKTNGKGLPLLDTLVRDGMMHDSFATCFNPTWEDGLLVLGAGLTDKMQFTPLVNGRKGFYAVDLLDVQYDGTSLGNAKGVKTVLDTGSTIMILVPELHRVFSRLFCATLQRLNLPPCENGTTVPAEVNITAEERLQFPPMRIDMPGATLHVPATNYLVPTPNSTYMVGVIVFDRASFNILGDVALMGHWVWHDRANSRVGFAPIEDCRKVSYDVHPPQILCPREATGGEAAAVIEKLLGGVRVWDDFDASPRLTYQAPRYFECGPNVVTFTATDSTGHSSSCSATAVLACGQQN